MGCVTFAQTPPDSGSRADAGQGRRLLPLCHGPAVRGAGGARTANQERLLTKAIQHYQEALKLDPGASIIFEELTDLYVQTGQLRDAVRRPRRC